MDVCIATESACIQPANKPAKRLRAFVEDPQGEFIWPVQEEEFIITIQEDGWNLDSVRSQNQEEDSISVQVLFTLETKVKDDERKTYWIYPNEDVADDFQRKHVFEIKPSVIVAKYVKEKFGISTAELGDHRGPMGTANGLK